MSKAGKGSTQSRGKGRGAAAEGKGRSRDQLASYVRKMLERLSDEAFSADAKELKGAIMPQIAESIQRLSEGAPDEVREKLNKALLDHKVLPSFEADVDALLSALSACQEILASSSASSGGHLAAESEVVDDSQSAASPERSKGKKGGYKAGEKGESSKGKGRWCSGKGGLEGPASSDAAGKLSSVKVRFCPDPRTVGAKFTGTYEPSPTCNFASLNAGDNAFFVGGKTINGQFANDLWNQAWQDTDRYKTLHERMFQAARPGELVAAPASAVAADPNVSAAFVRVLATSQKVGTVFIDIFKEDRRPLHVKNVAMVYTVGCQRRDCKSDDEFLDTVRAIACNVSTACTDYNALEVSPFLDMVRICLISGGAFAGKVPKAQVADAICLGIVEGSSAAHSPTFEFSYDGDEFQAAWKRLNAQ